MDRLSAEKSIAVFGFAGVIIGAVLPWARIIPFSVPGTDGNGVITLALGGVGLSFIMLGYTSTTAAAAAVLAIIALPDLLTARWLSQVSGTEASYFLRNPYNVLA